MRFPLARSASSQAIDLDEAEIDGADSYTTGTGVGTAVPVSECTWRARLHGSAVSVVRQAENRLGVRLRLGRSETHRAARRSDVGTIQTRRVSRTSDN